MTDKLTYHCKKCGTDQPEDQFYTRKTTNKIVYPCKTCKGNYYRKWKAEHPDYHKNWKTEHPEKVKQHHKKYRDRAKK